MLNFLYAKQDLEKFAQKDVFLLADHLGISSEDKDHDDLLWLLALTIHRPVKRSQMPPKGTELLFDPFALETLPLEKLFDIANHLDWPSITQLCQTSKYFNEQVCDNEIFWESFIHNKYPGYKKSTDLTWSKLAKKLRKIKRLPVLNQLREALRRKQLDIVKILVKYEPEEHDVAYLFKYEDKPWFKDIVILHSGALEYAAYRGRLKWVDKLIAAGADVDKADNDDRTSLWNAAYGGNTEIVGKLIVAGADVDKADIDGETPLSMAAYGGNTEIVDKLIAAGADVNKANNSGETPLWGAADMNRAGSVAKLITAGAEVDKANNDERTPLWNAAFRGHTEIVDKLITAGADVNKADKNEATPLSIATEEGYTEIVDKLITAGAKEKL